MATVMSLIASLFLAPAAYAQSFVVNGIPGCNFDTGEINAGQCIPSFLAHIVSTIFAFAGGVFLIVILFSAYEIIIGSLPGGSSESGKNRLTWAIIGFIICTTAFFVIDFIISAIGA